MTADPKLLAITTMAEALEKGGLSPGKSHFLATGIINDVAANAEAIGSKPGLVPLTAPQVEALLKGLDSTMTVKAAELHKAGSPDALINWYNDGADGQIDWGSPGDFDDCVSIAGQYLDNPEGFCQLRHIDATGEPAGQAPGEKSAKPWVTRRLPADLAKRAEPSDLLEDDVEGRRFIVRVVRGNEVGLEEL